MKDKSPKKILFVINPISGTTSKSSLPDAIEKEIDRSLIQAEIFWWNQVEDLEEAIRRFVESGGWGIVGVGGDGTINKIASFTVSQDMILMIMPAGSGNGLSRQLKYASNPESFLKWLNTAVDDERAIHLLDQARVNKRSFVNVSGLGFDAHIGHVFAELSNRGFWNYFKAVLKEFRSSRNIQFQIVIDGVDVHESAFLVSVANGTQWGNEFYIARKASLDDGLLDVVAVRKPSIIQTISLAYALRFRRSHSLITSYTGKNIRITSDSAVPSHIDGEPSEIGKDFSFTLEEKKLKFLLPKKLKTYMFLRY